MNSLLSTLNTAAMFCHAEPLMVQVLQTDSARLPAAAVRQKVILSMQVQHTGIFPSMKTRLYRTQDRRFQRLMSLVKGTHRQACTAPFRICGCFALSKPSNYKQVFQRVTSSFQRLFSEEADFLLHFSFPSRVFCTAGCYVVMKINCFSTFSLFVI